MPARTVDVCLSNQTSQTLALRDQHMEAGAWVITPPRSIEPGGWVHWRSVVTGITARRDGRAEFYVDYATIDEQTRVRVYGFVPQLGHNLFRLSVSGVTPIAADPSGPVYRQGNDVIFAGAVKSEFTDEVIACGGAERGNVYWIDGRPM